MNDAAVAPLFSIARDCVWMICKRRHPVLSILSALQFDSAALTVGGHEDRARSHQALPLEGARSKPTTRSSPRRSAPCRFKAMRRRRFVFSVGWSSKWTPTTGGLASATPGLCPDVTKQIVDAKLAPQLVGENPLNTEYLFEKMYRSTVAFGRKGAVLAAISAVDIALWDIKGQACGQPVFMLLGGRTKPAIPAYYSRLYTREHRPAAAGGGRTARNKASGR